MTARKWGNAIDADRPSPSDEIKALKELLLAKGVISEDEAQPEAKKTAKARGGPAA